MSRLVDRKWTLAEARQAVEDLTQLEKGEGAWEEVPAWAKQVSDETHTSVSRAAPHVGWEKAAITLKEAQEDDELRIEQLIQVIRAVRYCSHACIPPCPHTRNLDKAMAMLQPELRRRILEKD